MTFNSTTWGRALIGHVALLLIAALYGCDQLQPMAVDDHVPSGRRSTSSTSERLVGTYSLPIACTIQASLSDGVGCGAAGRYPVQLGPGTHFLKVRISGRTQVSPSCTWVKRELGPLGMPWSIYPPHYGRWYSIGYSTLTTIPYWVTPYSYVFMAPPVAVSADSSTVDYELAVAGNGEVIMHTQQPLPARCIQGSSLSVQIFVLEPVQPKLRLNCTPGGTIIRGDSIACVARAEPQGAVLTELAWSFTDSASHTIQGPTGTDTTWSGTIVVPGLLRVSGKVNGVASSDSLSVTVTPRTNWPKIQLLPAKNDGHGDLPPPSQLTNVGELAHTHFELLTASAIPVREIQDGPNKGWGYLERPITSFQVIVHVNDAWQPGNVWFNKQHYGTFYDPVQNAYGTYCTKAQVPQLLPSVLQHEGLQPGMVSHVQLLHQWFATQSPEAALEAAVQYPADSGASSAAMAILNVDINNVQSAALNEPAQRDGQPGSQVQLPLWPCKLRF